MFTVMALQGAGVFLIERCVIKDVNKDYSLKENEKQMELARLRLISILISSLFISTGLQVTFGFYGITRYNISCLVSYGLLDILSGVILGFLAWILIEYRMIIAVTAGANIFHVIVSYAIIREIKRAEYLLVI